MLVESIKLLDVEFFLRANEVVSPLMSNEEAQDLLDRLRAAESAKAADSYEPLWESKAFVVESRSEKGRFRVVLHLPALVTPLLNIYYPVVNDNQHSINPKWSDFNGIPSLSLPPTAYIYNDLWLEHPIIDRYLRQLESCVKVGKIEFIRRSHKREDCLILKADEQFYRSVLHLHALFQPVRQLISDLHALYILAPAPIDELSKRQRTKRLNQDLAAAQEVLNQHLTQAHSLYLLASTGIIENSLNQLLIDLYSHYDMPLEGWECFLQLTNSRSKANQDRLEQLIMAYYAQHHDDPNEQSQFLNTITTMFSYQKKNSSVTNLLARMIYPLVHNTIALDSSLTLNALWLMSSTEQLNECLVIPYPKLLLITIELLFFEQVQKHSPLDYIKAIDLLINVASPSSSILLIKCLNDFFVIIEAINEPETLGSKTPGYIINWAGLYQALQKKENPQAGPKISSILNLLFSHKEQGPITAANTPEIEVLNIYQLKASPYRQNTKVDNEHLSSPKADYM